MPLPAPHDRPHHRLTGIVGALLTPFGEDGRADRGRLATQLELLLGHVDAVSILGAEVSEYRALAAPERRAVLRESIAQVGGRVPTLAGVSAATLAETERLAAVATDAGATYVQVLLPPRADGVTPAPDEVVRFVEAVVERSALPVVLYHNPGHGSDPSLDALIAACSVPGVVAIKDSSRDISRILRAVELIDRAGHAAYLATVQPLLTVLLAGGSGAMMPAPATLVGAGIRDAVAHRVTCNERCPCRASWPASRPNGAPDMASRR